MSVGARPEGPALSGMLPGATALPTIATARLRLRALTPADAPALLAVFGDPSVCRYRSRPPLPDLGAAMALAEEIEAQFAERTLFQWGIAERETDAVVGTCTLAALSVEHRRAEVGFAIARRVWGRGYVAESLAALARFAFTELALHRLEADVDPRNAASIRALERPRADAASSCVRRGPRPHLVSRLHATSSRCARAGAVARRRLRAVGRARRARRAPIGARAAGGRGRAV